MTWREWVVGFLRVGVGFDPYAVQLGIGIHARGQASVFVGPLVLWVGSAA